MTYDNSNLTNFDLAILNREAAWWQMELPSGNVFFGDQKVEMLGYSENQFKTYQDFVKLVHPDDQKIIMDAMMQHLKGTKATYEAIYRIKASNNQYITFFDYGQIIKRENEKITVIGFVAKIKSTDNIEKEIEDYKELLTSGEISIIDLFGKLKSSI